MSQDAAFRKLLPWLAFLSLMFFVNYKGRSIIGPLLVYIEHDFGLDHSQATGLLIYLSTGFSICLVFAGFATSHITGFIVLGCVSLMTLPCFSMLDKNKQ